jgi:hypothetical protein
MKHAIGLADDCLVKQNPMPHEDCPRTRDLLREEKTLLQSEIGRFNKRAAAGEFAKPPNPPGKSILLPRVSARTARVQ